MDIKTKLTRSKLWAAIAGIIVGLVVAFGGEAETVETVAGGVMSVVSALVYIIAEAGIDKASASAPMNVDTVRIDAKTGEGAVENGSESH